MDEIIKTYNYINNQYTIKIKPQSLEEDTSFFICVENQTMIKKYE